MGDSYCPACGRYKARKRGWFRISYVCSYCEARFRIKGEVPIKKGWIFRRIVGYKTRYQISGGKKWAGKWRRLRKQVLANANHRCSVCGNSRGLQVHHIKPVSAGGTDAIDNLRALCAGCHKAAHSGNRFWFWW